METTATPTFRRRRPPGRSGGQRVGKDFTIVQGDGDLYPDESDSMTVNPVTVEPPTFRLSWMWALDWLSTNPGHWLKVPLVSPPDSEDYFREKNSVRSSIWRTAHRNDIDLESLEWRRAMWFRVIP
jgi:hypothetical protein